MTARQFDSSLSLGSRDSSGIAEYLMTIEDNAGASEALARSPGGQGLFSNPKAYSHTGTVLGFVPPSSSANSTKIISSKLAQADRSLIGKRIKITLDRFHVHDYPGTGKHQILCEFSGKNQVSGEVEELRFALQTEVADNAPAAISGHPIFLGVTVGPNGISFEGRTINLRSHVDDMVLSAINSQVFKSGLSLISTAQPALKPFASLAESVVKGMLQRKQNVQVHNFLLGLDFGQNATSIRLQLGSYVVIQTNDLDWDWSHYYLDSNTNALRVKPGLTASLDVNYMVFGISSFVEPTA